MYYHLLGLGPKRHLERGIIGLRRQVTLHDVARDAGVSIKTVSRVINGEPYVSPSTRARVHEAIERLGYRPNEVARSLKGKRSKMIGLMIADISNPFYAVIAKAVEEEARARGYSVVLCASGEDVEVEREYVELLFRKRLDGLLLVPAANGHEYLLREIAAGLHVVALDRPIDDPEVDAVLVENQEGAYRATLHLVEHGHKRIGFIGAGKQLYTLQERLAGYQKALEEHGLQSLVRLDAPDPPSAADAMRELLDSPDRPTAVFCMNNLITIGVLEALEERGLRVPDDMATVGFDDFDLAGLLRPRLTLVRQPVDELGRQGARLLFERLEGLYTAAARRIVLPTKLMVRESCGCSYEQVSSKVSD